MKFFKSCTSWSSMKSDEVYELFGDMSFSYFYEKITLKDKRYGGQMLKEINRDISSISHLFGVLFLPSFLKKHSRKLMKLALF